MLLPLRNHFNGSQCHLLTFKSIDAKHDINFVNRLCKRVSKTYVIVRERNKITEGYHYHAILKLTSLPKKSWYRKGIHMNLKRIGVTTRSSSAFTKKDRHNMLTDLVGRITPLDEQDLMGKQEDDFLITSIEQSAYHMVYKVHIDRTLVYLSKEMELPAQYADYILSIKGKMTSL